MQEIGGPLFGGDGREIARRAQAKERDQVGGKGVRVVAGPDPAQSAKFNQPGRFPIDLSRWCFRLHGRANAGIIAIAASLENAAATSVKLNVGYLAIAAERPTAPP